VEVRIPEPWIHLLARSTRTRWRCRVSDDGRGGARLGSGSGLRGLRDRLEAVDGQLDISSPADGPTLITARLPVRL
jgi:signal transduction histidine kinase